MTEPTYTLTRATLESLIANCGSSIGMQLLRSLTPNSGEAVGKVISSGPADLPIFQWISADHSLRCKTGDLLFTHPAPSTKPADGWVLMPIEPTERMLELVVPGFYAQLLAAAPQQGETK